MVGNLTNFYYLSGAAEQILSQATIRGDRTCVPCNINQYGWLSVEKSSWGTNIHAFRLFY